MNCPIYQVFWNHTVALCKSQKSFIHWRPSPSQQLSNRVWVSVLWLNIMMSNLFHLRTVYLYFLVCFSILVKIVNINKCQLFRTPLDVCRGPLVGPGCLVETKYVSSSCVVLCTRYCVSCGDQCPACGAPATGGAWTPRGGILSDRRRCFLRPGHALDQDPGQQTDVVYMRGQRCQLWRVRLVSLSI